MLKLTKDCIPFGNLTLLNSQMNIDNQEWKTPIHYIFTKLQSSNLYMESMKQCNTNDLVFMCEKFIQLKRMQVATKCIQHYLHIKSENNVLFLKELASMEKGSTLKCNIFPKNIYGYCLEQLRDEKIGTCEPKEQQRNDPIFFAYLAEKALKEILATNNLDEYLAQRFQRMSDLLRYLERKFGRDKIIRKSPDRNTIIQIHKKLGVDYTTHPDTLIRLVRKKNIRRIYEINTSKLKHMLYDLFIQHHSNVYPNSFDKQERIAQDKETMPFNVTIQFIERIFTLYRERNLPNDLLVKMDISSKDLYLPSEQEMVKYEQEVFPLHPGPDLLNETSISNVTTQPVIEITKTMHSWPFAVDNLKINNMTFPTVIHYYVYCSIMNDSDIKSEKFSKSVMKTLLQQKPDALIQNLVKWQTEKLQEKLDNLLKYVMNLFFKNEKNQHLLLATGNDKLFVEPFDSCKTSIISFSKFGKMLESIRNKSRPKIYRISSLQQVKDIYIVKNWIQYMINLTQIAETIYNNWFQAKGSSFRITNNFIHNFLWIDHTMQDSVESITTGLLKRFKKFTNDLHIVVYMLQMQYKFNNFWMKPKNYVEIIPNTSSNMILLAFTKILMLFDKIIDIKVVIDNIDLHYATQLLNMYIEVSDVYVEEKEEEEDYEDDGSDVISDYNDADFEGMTDVYTFLSQKCFNEITDNIEELLIQSIKQVNVKNKSVINFFAGGGHA